MNRLAFVGALLGLASATGCSDDANPGTDAATLDATHADANLDAANADSGNLDASNSDSGNLDASNADTVTPDTVGSDTGAPEGTRVFVTSTKSDGALGGLGGGDGVCQERAESASLGGTWLAWLGDGTDGPASRFVQSEAAYQLVGGDIIAEDWEDLIDGTIAVPINRDETGTILPADDDMIVWTAVFHTGGNPTPVNCSGWTVADTSIVPTGLASATDTGWTVTAPYSCSELHRLYCFEQ